MKTFFIKTMLTTILLLCITFSVVNNKIYFEVNVDNISDSIYKDIKEQYFKNINIKLNKKHLYLMEEARINYDIPMHIFYNVMYYESSFNSNAISKTGARGYMQLTGICIKHYNIVNGTKLRKKTLSVKDNLTVGAWYLRYLKNRADINHPTWSEYKKWKLALMRYNGEPTKKHIYAKKILYNFKLN